MAFGTVARFDSRRGYGFLIPDDEGEDVFVHQNNINMDGFRYLRQGERVSYELEVGEKGMKAVQVELLEPREPQPPRESRRPRQHNGRTRTAEKFQEQDDGRVDDLEHDLDRLRRKMERLLSVLVAKGVMEPSDLDDLDDVASLQRAANAEEEPEAEADPEAAAEADYQDAESY